MGVLSFSASGFFYIATGFLGYVAFRAKTEANVLSNLEELGWIATTVNALFAASLIVSYPLICFVVREPVRRVLFWIVSFFVKENPEEEEPLRTPSPNKDLEQARSKIDGNLEKELVLRSHESPPLMIFVLEAAIVTSATLAAAIALPGIDIVLELIGGTAAVFVSYIAPVGLFYIVRPEHSFESYRKKAFAIGLAGAMVGMLSLMNLWHSITAEEHANS